MVLLGIFELKNAENRDFFSIFVPLKSIRLMQGNNRSFLASISPVTRHLLIINVLVWLTTLVFQHTGFMDLTQWLGLHFWKGSHFRIWQFVTHMFMHDTQGIVHIFFNMFMLWMFGSLLERVLGSKRFLFYYFACGIGAALLQELVWQFSWQSILLERVTGPAGTTVTDIINAANQGMTDFTMDDFFNGYLGGGLITVGASGAIFGILLAFGMIFPNMPMYLFFIPIPIKAKWVVIGNGLLELYFGISGNQPGVAHFAHLGGMIAGIILILYWRHTGVLRRSNGFY